MLAPWKESYDQPRQHVKNQRHHYGCESWTIKKAEDQRTDYFKLLKKTLESPLDSKEIKPVSSKGNQH